MPLGNWAIMTDCGQKWLTKNPRKLAGLAQLGFDVKREPIEIPATDA
jgi:hypothetical protein